MRPATPSTNIDLNPFIDAIREDLPDSKATFIESIMDVITRKRSGALDAEEKAICLPYIVSFYIIFIETKKSRSLYATLKPRYAELLDYNIGLCLKKIDKKAAAAPSPETSTTLPSPAPNTASSGLFGSTSSSARSDTGSVATPLSVRKSFG